MTAVASVPSPRRVFVAVDGSGLGDQAIRVAAQTATLWQAELDLVHVAAAAPHGAAHVEVLERATAIAREFAGDLRVRRVRRTGPVAAALADLTGPNDVLVVGGHAHSGPADAVLGSVALEVVEHAAGPVLVAGPGSVRALGGRVVAAIANEQEDGAVLDLAFAEAAVRGVGLTVVHGSAQRGRLRRVVAGRRSAGHPQSIDGLHPWRVRHGEVEVVVEDSADAPDRAVLHAAVGAGLVVLGSHGRGPRAGWVVGSVDQAVLRAARCPVMIAPPGWRKVGGL